MDCIEKPSGTRIYFLAEFKQTKKTEFEKSYIMLIADAIVYPIAVPKRLTY